MVGAKYVVMKKPGNHGNKILSHEENQEMVGAKYLVMKKQGDHGNKILGQEKTRGTWEQNTWSYTNLGIMVALCLVGKNPGDFVNKIEVMKKHMYHRSEILGHK